MGTSISAAIHAIETEPSAFDAVVLLTCDQPNVSAALIDNLIANTPGSASSARRIGVCGDTWNPGAVWARLLSGVTRAAAGQRRKGNSNASTAMRWSLCRFEPAAVDLDTPADYEQFTRDGGATTS
jgi:CTP:molybdopterin cytidylyltransferase MocA